MTTVKTTKTTTTTSTTTKTVATMTMTTTTTATTTTTTTTTSTMTMTTTTTATNATMTTTTVTKIMTTITSMSMTMTTTTLTATTTTTTTTTTVDGGCRRQSSRSTSMSTINRITTSDQWASGVRPRHVDRRDSVISVRPVATRDPFNTSRGADGTPPPPTPRYITRMNSLLGAYVRAASSSPSRGALVRDLRRLSAVEQWRRFFITYAHKCHSSWVARRPEISRARNMWAVFLYFSRGRRRRYISPNHFAEDCCSFLLSLDRQALMQQFYV